jgi:hypothetical protein
VTAVTAIDRFLLPAGEPGIASYLFERLLAPHNLRERLRRSALAAVPSLAPRLLPRLVSGDGHRPALATLETALEETSLLRGTPLEDQPEDRPVRWLLAEDYAGNGRRRLVAFLFAAGERSPAAVLKLQGIGTAGPSLEREAAALQCLAERLPQDLQRSVPRCLAFRTLPGLEALLSDPLAGVSAYMDMQGLLAPGRAVERHFQAAAAWLARFHRATRIARDLAAAHGDFWARNLLLGPDGEAAVVDWEHFREEAPFWEDLFHFALTYGLNYPWRRWRRLPPEAAFRRTFLEKNRVSRAVSAYFARYADASGSDGAALRQQFGHYLETRPEEGLPWSDFRRLFGRARRSVFSG